MAGHQGDTAAPLEACLDDDSYRRVDTLANSNLGGGGDRMSNLGAGLGNIDWNSQALSKFEKK